MLRITAGKFYIPTCNYPPNPSHPTCGLTLLINVVNRSADHVSAKMTAHILFVELCKLRDIWEEREAKLTPESSRTFLLPHSLTMVGLLTNNLHCGGSNRPSRTLLMRTDIKMRENQKCNSTSAPDCTLSISDVKGNQHPLTNLEFNGVKMS